MDTLHSATGILKGILNTATFSLTLILAGPFVKLFGVYDFLWGIRFSMGYTIFYGVYDFLHGILFLPTLCVFPSLCLSLSLCLSFYYSYYYFFLLSKYSFSPLFLFDALLSIISTLLFTCFPHHCL
jgi:hypothetical protein